MAWFIIVQELFRLHVVFMLAFVPLFLFGLFGLWKQKRHEFILFVFVCLGAAVIIDLRIIITGQLLLLCGWVYWLKEKPKIFVSFSVLLLLFFLWWWVSQKLWYFGVIL